LPNEKPVADAGPDQVVVDDNLDGGEVVTLDGSASFDSDGAVTAYEWETEDGQIVASEAVTQVWLPVGRHTVKLIVTDDGGARDSDRVVVEVQAGNATPVADAGPDVAATDGDSDGSESVTLDGTASYDPDGHPLRYEWSVDGQVVATGATPAIMMPVGRWEVVLKVTDSPGATAEDASGASSEDTVVVTVDAASTSEPASTEASAADAPVTSEETPTTP
jgi:hypothetical protein